jgi:Family of unknown function (DUF5647)
MSKQDVKKNFDLAEKFIHYTVKHPEAVKGVGKRASIVTIKPSDKRLTEKNLELARKLKKERRVVYIAAFQNGRWEVQRFAIRPAAR